MPASVPYDNYLIESLKNQRRAEAYLTAALEDGDPRVVLMALRNVAQALGYRILPFDQPLLLETSQRETVVGSARCRNLSTRSGSSW